MSDASSQPIIGNILIVDDVPDNVRLLSRTLTQKGHKVRGVLSGEMALRASSSLPDLILLDIMMPDMNGYEVCEKLKQNPRTSHIPIIFLSALDETANKVKAFEVGGVDYLTKPFQLAEVHARVEHQLKLQQLQKQLTAQAEALQEQNVLLQSEINERKQAEEELRQSEIKERQQKQELGEALVELRQAQAQLIQQEKMSGLGQLVAGVAHEINNPVTFIYGNLECAGGYAHDLLQALEIYQRVTPQLPDEVKTEVDDLGLDFISEDFPKLLASINVGAERIREIVDSLRIFSRHSEGKVQSTNIHEGIDSTLMILRSRLRSGIGETAVEVEKNYGELPPVECYSGQLNQVFMNILSNAIDALSPLRQQEQPDEQHVQRQPMIQIQTKSLETGKVGIYISDNDPGISKDVKTKLFDPFFTTKDIGKGTGLGLSISYKIVVERHGGELRCISFPGQGAMFAIEIPIIQNSTPT